MNVLIERKITELGDLVAGQTFVVADDAVKEIQMVLDPLASSGLEQVQSNCTIAVRFSDSSVGTYRKTTLVVLLNASITVAA